MVKFDISEEEIKELFEIMNEELEEENKVSDLAVALERILYNNCESPEKISTIVANIK